MNKNNLKSYAPKARLDFIAAITARAQQLGFTSTAVHDATLRGDVLIINGVEWPAKVASQRAKLLEKILQHGFEQTIEEIAYTWFNRFAALRYMELHEFLDHGHRVLSSRDGGLPELLRHAGEVNLPGLQPAYVQELQLAGNQDNALYKLLLVAQCNELSRTMPFLFEFIDDETELLLPDNLLHTDSIVAKMVSGVPEEDWQEIEVIGWLYQFYISEKKGQVIGKVVKSEDIPAATQLFTPNWIVQYLVQNSVGRLWLMANPSSTLGQQWPYYIQPAQQTPEVQAQLDALTQTRIAEDGDTLNPETITVLDPACGSGHILVVAYDVLKAIYLERGYRLRDIPRLILEKNLYALDIDDRAAQLASFTLLMKARADDRRLLNDPDNPPKLNILSLQESQGLDLDRLVSALQTSQPAPQGTAISAAPLSSSDLFPETQPQMSLGESGVPPLRPAIATLLDCFTHAKTFGSLIQIGPQANEYARYLLSILSVAEASGDLYAQAAANDLLPLVRQALVLGMQFDAVVANPPYMGGKGMNPALKDYARATFPDSKADLFAMFMERGFGWCKPSGLNSMVTMQSWMFLSSYEEMREKLLTQRTIQTMAHLGARAFGEISGEVVQTTAFVLHGQRFLGFKPVFFRLVDGQEAEKGAALRGNQNRFDTTVQDDFKIIPGSPVAYWASKSVINAFAPGVSLGAVAKPRTGLNTTDNATFLRLWHEVDFREINFSARSLDDSARASARWYPFQKGGEFRKWYGNNEYIVNWKGNGEDIKSAVMNNPRDNTTTHWSRRIFNTEFFFKEGACWSTISSARFSARYLEPGFIISNAAGGIFPDKLEVGQIVALTNSTIPNFFFTLLNPTINYSSGLVAQCPVMGFEYDRNVVSSAIALAKADWDISENSWGFQSPPILAMAEKPASTLESSYFAWTSQNRKAVGEMMRLEEANNRLFINAYGLQDELSPEVPEDQITLTRADREKDCQRLISYAIGCMLGRYSLDEPGLIYAHAGNVGFDPSRYPSFPADADGILPVTDQPWFADDAPSRIREFLDVVWGPDTLEENISWLAESLGPKASETPEETIRRYIADQFFKDHLQTYKKRPIYWLFSSGKQGAFQALVYLHRYHEGTLARMRSEYVIPLTAKYAARLELLTQDASAAPSAAARTKITKQLEKLRKQQAELLAFDEKLRHYADMRIALDLDDGVKVNYGKFGDLLDSVKIVTGGGSDD